MCTTVKEKDLGVTISADMKVSEQCGIAASKGNHILGLIRRNITYKDKKPPPTLVELDTDCDAVGEEALPSHMQSYASVPLGSLLIYIIGRA